MNNKNKILTGILILVIGLILITGLSYAYFSANISGGEDATTITVTGGKMDIIYTNNRIINIQNIIPSDKPIDTKTFTVTGNNTTDIKMFYNLNLVVEENSFSEQALKFKLISINTDNNGIIVPSINTLTNIGTGSKNIILGTGSFDSPTDGNKVHTYNLEMYFPNANYNQNIDQEKMFKGYIEIKSGKEPAKNLHDSILAQGGGIDAIGAKGTPDFNNIYGTSGIYAADDDYGTSYYYRGRKDELNNNLIWAGFQWKIVRINGDGSIRLVYNGTEEKFNTNKIMSSTGEETSVFYRRWHSPNDDAKYVGYMFGGGNWSASTVRDGSTNVAATYNQTDTDIKKEIDNWYKINILDKGFSDIVTDNLFCNDRQLSSEVGGDPTGPGYGKDLETYYAAYYRNDLNKIPTLKCGKQNDRFTAEDTVFGNGSLTYPVGLLTVDEASHAGLRNGSTNNTNYLYTNRDYWLFSPDKLRNDGYAFGWTVLKNGNLGSIWSDTNEDVRPSISLSASSLATGTGSLTDPFMIN